MENGDELFPPSKPYPGERTYIDVVVPDEVWRAVSLAAIQASEQLGINVTVQGGYSASLTRSNVEYSASVNECPAVAASLGAFDQHGRIIDEANRFSVRSSGDLTSCSVEFNTKKSSGLENELGL